MAAFDSTGKIQSAVKLESCFQCHTSREETDYNYTYFEWKHQRAQADK